MFRDEGALRCNDIRCFIAHTLIFKLEYKSKIKPFVFCGPKLAPLWYTLCGHSYRASLIFDTHIYIYIILY